jgi:hypothetical protein
MEAQATLGWFGRLGNLIFSPARTFDSLIAKPDWVTPMLLTVVIMLTFSISLKDVLMDFQAKTVRESIMKNDQIAESQKAQTAEQAVDMMKKFWIVGAVFGTITGIGLYFVIGLIYWLVGNKIMDGKPQFFQVLSIYGYASLIEMFGLAIKIPIMMANGTIRVDTGLALLAPDAELTLVTYVILSKLDVFSVWAVVLIAMGLARLYQKPLGKSALTVGIIWMGGLLIAVGLSLMGLSFGM